MSAMNNSVTEPRGWFVRGTPQASTEGAGELVPSLRSLCRSFSFAPAGLLISHWAPTACAVGGIVPPLRGFAYSIPSDALTDFRYSRAFSSTRGSSTVSSLRSRRTTLPPITTVSTSDAFSEYAICA
jgi:hypothetical protein